MKKMAIFWANSAVFWVARRSTGLALSWNERKSSCAVAQYLCVFLKNRSGQLTTFLAGLSYTPVGRVSGCITKGA
jgi:hypothetical protein